VTINNMIDDHMAGIEFFFVGGGGFLLLR